MEEKNMGVSVQWGTNGGTLLTRLNNYLVYLVYFVHLVCWFDSIPRLKL